METRVIETTAGARLVAVVTYHQRHLAKGAGFRWDPNYRHWWKPAHAAATAAREDDWDLPAVSDRIAMSRALTSEIDVPAPQGLAYRGYQMAAIEYAQDRNTLIAAPVGAGKTIIGAGLINLTRPASVLIVSPATIKGVWERELAKWLTVPMGVQVITGRGQAQWAGPEADVVIMNYDIASYHIEALRRRRWDLAIYDEAHRLKNPKAKRTQVLLGRRAAVNAKHLICLSGTPIINRPKELWPVVSRLCPGAFPDFMKFARKFCNAQPQDIYIRDGGGEMTTVWNFDGASNLSELQDLLRGWCMVRWEKHEIQPELPPVVRQTINLDTDGKARELLERELTLIAEGCARRRLKTDRLEDEDEDTAYERLLDQEIRRLTHLRDTAENHNWAREAEAADIGEMSAVRKALGISKIAQAVTFLQDAIEDGDKVLCFAHHREVITQIAEAFGDTCIRIDGSVPPAKRMALVDRFQTDDTCRIAVLQTQAAGEGITLTASSHVVFIELDWTPAAMEQAEGRSHRMGQTADTVLVHYLVYPESMDAHIAELLERKKAIATAALDRDV